MKLALLAGLLMSLGLVGVLVGTLLRVHQSYTPEERTDYAVLLDAGSTATRAYIYQWRQKTTHMLPYVSISLSDQSEPHTKKIQPGIATLVPNVTSIGNYLDPLIHWAQDKIPKKAVTATPIFLQGTGGLRKLPGFDSSTLLSSVRYKLKDSGFYFENTFAAILSGAEEAAYGFVSVNALFNRFAETGDAPLTTYGSLDMGGVSAEIAFMSAQSPPLNYSYTTNINGTDYSIYVQSNDGWGINDARYQFNASLFLSSPGTTVLDPCAPYGYYENVTAIIGGIQRSFILAGTSDPVGCKLQVEGLVQNLTASYPKPPVTGTFVVADKYIKVKDFYKLKDNANLVELNSKVSSFCSLSLEDAIARHSKDAHDIQEYCFMGTYVSAMLGNYYGLSTTQRHIFWKDYVKKTPITWTLGSLLGYVNTLAPTPAPTSARHYVRFYHTDGGAVLLFASGLLFVLGLILFILQRHHSADYVLIQ